MKIQCNACEMAEARVLCCADEAALCYACDEKVHAANKLAGKHQRVPLTGSASQVPKCDICKEASGFFFCLEDRALLCRKCDTSIHSMNAHVSAHQRFLLTGVKVGADPPEQISVSKEQSSPVSGNIEYPSKQPQKRSSSMPSSGETCQTISDQVVNQTVSDQVNHNANLPGNEISYPGGSISGNTYYWHPEEYFDFANFNQNYGFNEHVSSKSDSGKSEGLESSSVYSSSDEELSNGLLVQVPEIPWTVPELPSPPTYSGLSWSKNAHTQLIEDSVFVPDISYSFEDMRQCQRSSPVTKRQRTLNIRWQ